MSTPALPRPSTGGDALRLADLALARRDARDAVAQYRALLVAPPADVRPYAELQLARAHLALSEPAQAEPLLRRVVASNSAASWPAVLELAALLLADPRNDAATVLRQLEPYADGHLEQLHQHLLWLASEAQLVSMRDLALQRTGDPARLCIVERHLQERILTPRLPPVNVCPSRSEPVGARRPNYQGFFLDTLIQNFQAELTRPATTARSWVAIAVDAATATREDPGSPMAEIASWYVVAACLNASAVAAHHDVQVLPRFRQLEEIRAGVIVPHRPYLESAIATWSPRDPD